MGWGGHKKRGKGPTLVLPSCFFFSVSLRAATGKCGFGACLVQISMSEGKLLDAFPQLGLSFSVWDLTLLNIKL